MCSMYGKGQHATRPRIYNTTKALDSGNWRHCRLPHSGCMPPSLRDGRLFHSTLDTCLARRSTPVSLTGSAPRSIDEADSPLRTSTARPESAGAGDARTEEDLRSREGERTGRRREHERERAGTKRNLNARKREQTIPQAKQPGPKKPEHARAGTKRARGQKKRKAERERAQRRNSRTQNARTRKSGDQKSARTEEKRGRTRESRKCVDGR